MRRSRVNRLILTLGAALVACALADTAYGKGTSSEPMSLEKLDEGLQVRKLTPSLNVMIAHSRYSNAPSSRS
jgi:hypothetical protein